MAKPSIMLSSRISVPTREMLEQMAKVRQTTMTKILEVAIAREWARQETQTASN